jgi:hypothetical protein
MRGAELFLENSKAAGDGLNSSCGKGSLLGHAWDPSVAKAALQYELACTPPASDGP